MFCLIYFRAKIAKFYEIFLKYNDRKFSFFFSKVSSAGNPRHNLGNPKLQGVPLHIGSLLALNYDFRYKSENLRKINQFKKSYKAIVTNFLQKMLGFSSIMCVFLSLNCGDNPI